MSDDAPGKKSKSPFSPTLIVLLVILVLAGGALLVDMGARRGAAGAYQTLSEKLPSDDDPIDGELIEINQAAVEKIMGRKADGPAAEIGGQLQETYTWRGPLKLCWPSIFILASPLLLPPEPAPTACLG